MQDVFKKKCSGILLNRWIQARQYLIFANAFFVFVSILCSRSEASWMDGPNIDRLHFQSISKILHSPEVVFIDIEQDQMGMIWLLSFDELIRFDGYEFRVFSTELDENQMGVDQYQQALYIDKRDQIWVGRGCVASRFDRSKQGFEHYLLSKTGEFSGIAGFVQDENNNLLLLSTSGKLYRFDENKNHFEVVIDPKDSIACYSFEIDKLGELWAGGDGVLYHYDIAMNEVEEVFHLSSTYQRVSNRIFSLKSYMDSVLLLGTENSELILYNCKNGSFETVPINGWIYSIEVDIRHNIYLSSTGGVTIIEHGSEKTYHYSHNRENPYSIPPGSIWSILIDQENNLWVGSSRSGLLVAYPNTGFEDLHFHSTWQPSLPTKNNVSAIFEDSKGRLWLGYHNNGVEMFDFENDQQWYTDHFTEGNTQIGKGSVYKITEMPDGQILLGISDIGLSSIDPVTHIVENTYFDWENPESIGGSDVRDIIVDDSDNLWLMFHHNAIDYYETSTGIYHHIVSNEKPVAANLDLWFFDILLDSENRLWVCSSWGLWVYKNGELDQGILEGILAGSRLRELTSNCIWQGFDDCMWVGTNRGLFCINLKKGVIDSFSQEDGLPSDNIHSINGIEGGSIWISTDKGICEFDPTTHQSLNYGKRDGLPTRDYYIGSTWKSESGHLFFGGKHGVVKFIPSNIQHYKKQPSVIISGFNLYNQTVPVLNPEDPNTILTKPIEQTERIVLPYEPYTITFNYVGLSFRNALKNQYSYKLEGFDDQWSKPSVRRDCTYTNLDPGTYVFRVKASNCNGFWNETGASLTLVISPPYWQWIWVRLLLVLSIAGIIGAAFYWRIRSDYHQQRKLELQVADQTHQIRLAMHESESQKSQIIEKNQLLLEYQQNLETRIDERTKELQLAKQKAEESDRIKSAFLANMSHEFRTPLNAIIGSVSVLGEEDLNKEDRDYYTSAMKRSSDILIKLLDSILYLSRMETGELPIQYALIDVYEFITRVHLNFLDFLNHEEHKDIKVILDTPPYSAEPDVFFGDPKHLEQSIHYLLENAFKFTNKGSIRLGYQIVRDHANGPKIQFNVTDTGLGIPKQQVALVFERFTKFYNNKELLHSGIGLGLTLVKKLTESMGGNVLVDSVVGKGTTMIIEFPFKEDLE